MCCRRCRAGGQPFAPQVPGHRGHDLVPGPATVGRMVLRGGAGFDALDVAIDAALDDAFA